MREIKFRAWDKEKKIMFNWSFTEQGLYPQDFFNNDNYQVMQYTGLTDKNGKEIWEGDVLQWLAEHELGTLIHKREVVFINGFFGMDSVIGYQPLNTYPLQNIEVIGNIHENPELLQVSK